MKIFKHTINLRNQIKQIILNPFSIIHKIKVFTKLYNQTYKLKPALRQLKNRSNLKGVEIGVFRGDNSRNAIKKLDIKKIYLIDPYTKHYGLDYNNYDYNTIEKAKIKAKKKLKRYDCIKWVYKKSENACDFIPNNLDFVYIDGDHSYKHVKQDIENYLPKLKKGGLMSGHDYRPNKKSDVVKAVNEAVNKKGYKLNNKNADWWFWKV